MAKDFNNRLITPELEKAMQDYPLYSQDSKKKDAVCIAVFSSATLAGTFLKDSERMMILCFLASL